MNPAKELGPRRSRSWIPIAPKPPKAVMNTAMPRVLRKPGSAVAEIVVDAVAEVEVIGDSPNMSEIRRKRNPTAAMPRKTESALTFDSGSPHKPPARRVLAGSITTGDFLHDGAYDAGSS